MMAITETPHTCRMFLNSPIGAIRIAGDEIAIREVHFLKEDELVELHIEFDYLLKDSSGPIHKADQRTDVDFEILNSEIKAQNRNRDGLAFDLLKNCKAQLLDYFNGVTRQFTLPFKQRGTLFQEKVWEQLAAIRYGETISYLELAKKLGDPKVIRASAAANGRNQLAIIVPCHRVIGSSGDLVGYAGGMSRKKWLLEHEKKFTHGVQTLF